MANFIHQNEMDNNMKSLSKQDDIIKPNDTENINTNTKENMKFDNTGYFEKAGGYVYKITSDFLEPDTVRYVAQTNTLLEKYTDNMTKHETKRQTIKDDIAIKTNFKETLQNEIVLVQTKIQNVEEE